MKTFKDMCPVEARDIHEALHELEKAIVEYEYCENSFYDYLELDEAVVGLLDRCDTAFKNLQIQVANTLRIIL